MNKVREILDYVYSCDVKSDKQDKERILSQAQKEIWEAVKEVLPLRTMHTITHGNISHPHETQEDNIHNETRTATQENLKKLFEEEK